MKDDRDKIIKLIEEVWGKERGEMAREYWSWELEGNPNSPPGCSFTLVIECDNKIVALISTQPIILKIGEKVLRASWLTEAMAHPAYRGRYMAPRVLKKITKTPPSPILLGNPNDNVYHLCTRYGFFDTCQPPTMFNVINMENVLKTKIQNKIVIKLGSAIWNIFSKIFFSTKYHHEIKDVIIKRVSAFDDRIDNFWKEVSADFNIIAVRNKKYLNWKFVECPVRRYTIFIAEKEEKILGYIVFRDEERANEKRGYIVDFLAKTDDKRIIRSLISKAVECFKTRKVDFIICLGITCNKVYQKALRRNGFIFSKHDIICSRFMGYTNLPEVSQEYLRNPQNWFITRAETNIDIVC